MEADKPDFQTCYFNLANDELAYNKFVSKPINESELNDRIQFKIIHLKSKTNWEENFDATEELYNLTRNNDATTSGNEKKRTRTIFGAGTKSVEKYNAGPGKWSTANPKICSWTIMLITNKKLFQKRWLKSAVRRITALQKLNWEIF